MRKVLCFLAVIAIAAPAFAGDITFTVTSSASGQFTIGYVATDPCDVPVGIGLKVVLTDATVDAVGDVVSVDSFFDVFIDYASAMPDPNLYTIGIAGQHPLADPCDAGVPSLPASEFSLCLGALDPCNAASATVVNLVTIDVNCSGPFDVAIYEDDLRGGVVGASFGAVNTNGATDLSCAPPPECMAATNPDYGLWDTLGKPDCWCYERQCRGDVNGLQEFGMFWVFQNDLAVFKDAFGLPTLPAGGICADLDHAMEFGMFRVFQNDLADFKTYFGSPSVTSCASPPDANFNFWLVP